MKNGFTLIELLVVVLIIGILSAIALPQYQKSVLKARFVNAKVLATDLAQAQEVFKLENGEYTAKLEYLSIEMPPNRSGSVCSGNSCNYKWGRVRIASDKSYVAATLWSDGTNDEVGYIIPLTGDESPYCLVYNTATDIYKQLCASDTGNSKSHWSGTKYYYDPTK